MDQDTFWEAFDAVLEERDAGDCEPSDMGEDFDIDDEDEMRRRLPRLAALCLGSATA